MRERFYRSRGIDGCITESTSKSSGSKLRLYCFDQISNAEVLDLCLVEQRAPYTLYCEDHHAVRFVSTIADGKKMIATPYDWCVGCMLVVASKDIAEENYRCLRN